MTRIGHIGGLHAAAALMALSMANDDGMERIVVNDIAPKRQRNYDIEGPKPEAGPPQAPQPLTRQQRRKLERQAAKSRFGR